jgi:hypothetical protein
MIQINPRINQSRSARRRGQPQPLRPSYFRSKSKRLVTAAVNPPVIERLEVRPVSYGDLSPLHAVGELWRPLRKAVALTRSRVGLALLFR